MATRVTLPTITRGDDYPITIRFWSDADKTTSVDVADREFASQLRRNPDDDDVVEFDVDMSAADDGIVIISLAADDTADLAPVAWAWDFQQVTDGGTTTLFKSTIPVTRDVTRTVVGS